MFLVRCVVFVLVLILVKTKHITLWVIIWNITLNTREVAGTKCSLHIREGERKTTLPVVL